MLRSAAEVDPPYIDETVELAVGAPLSSSNSAGSRDDRVNWPLLVTEHQTAGQPDAAEWVALAQDIERSVKQHTEHYDCILQERGTVQFHAQLSKTLKATDVRGNGYSSLMQHKTALNQCLPCSLVEWVVHGVTWRFAHLNAEYHNGVAAPEHKGAFHDGDEFVRVSNDRSSVVPSTRQVADHLVPFVERFLKSHAADDEFSMVGLEGYLAGAIYLTQLTSHWDALTQSERLHDELRNRIEDAVQVGRTLSDAHRVVDRREWHDFLRRVDLTQPQGPDVLSEAIFCASQPGLWARIAPYPLQTLDISRLLGRWLALDAKCAVCLPTHSPREDADQKDSGAPHDLSTEHPRAAPASRCRITTPAPDQCVSLLSASVVPPGRSDVMLLSWQQVHAYLSQQRSGGNNSNRQPATVSLPIDDLCQSSAAFKPQLAAFVWGVLSLATFFTRYIYRHRRGVSRYVITALWLLAVVWAWSTSGSSVGRFRLDDAHTKGYVIAAAPVFIPLSITLFVCLAFGWSASRAYTDRMVHGIMVSVDYGDPTSPTSQGRTHVMSLDRLLQMRDTLWSRLRFRHLLPPITWKRLISKSGVWIVCFFVVIFVFSNAAWFLYLQSRRSLAIVGSCTNQTATTMDAHLGGSFAPAYPTTLLSCTPLGDTPSPRCEELPCPHQLSVQFNMFCSACRQSRAIGAAHGAIFSSYFYFLFFGPYLISLLSESLVAHVAVLSAVFLPGLSVRLLASRSMYGGLRVLAPHLPLASLERPHNVRAFAEALAHQQDKHQRALSHVTAWASAFFAIYGLSALALFVALWFPPADGQQRRYFRWYFAVPVVVGTFTMLYTVNRLSVVAHTWDCIVPALRTVHQRLIARTTSSEDAPPAQSVPALREACNLVEELVQTLDQTSLGGVYVFGTRIDGQLSRHVNVGIALIAANACTFAIHEYVGGGSR